MSGAAAFLDREVELCLTPDGDPVLIGRVVDRAAGGLLLAPRGEALPPPRGGGRASPSVRPGRQLLVRAALEDGPLVAPARVVGFGFSGRVRLGSSAPSTGRGAVGTSGRQWAGCRAPWSHSTRRAGRRGAPEASCCCPSSCPTGRRSGRPYP